MRLHLRLDEPIRPDVMRKALDLTAKRYPYFCVSLKRNEREAYYVRNDSPVALVYISMIQTFREDVYYQVFLKELEENGITVNEYGMTPIQTAEVRF